MSKIYIYGASGHGLVVTIKRLSYDRKIFYQYLLEKYNEVLKNA